MDDLPLVLETAPDPEDVRCLEDALNRYNVEVTGIPWGGPIACFLREGRQITAGLYSWIWGGTLYVQSLWVTEALRGRGIARRMLRAAEDEAYRRGCRQAVLDTHNPRARDLYQRLGYEIYGVAEGYPAGGAHCHLRKTLTGTEA